MEAYYKTMQNDIDYRNGAQVFTNEAIETQLFSEKAGHMVLNSSLKRKPAGLMDGSVIPSKNRTKNRRHQ